MVDENSQKSARTDIGDQGENVGSEFDSGRADSRKQAVINWIYRVPVKGNPTRQSLFFTKRMGLRRRVKFRLSNFILDASHTVREMTSLEMARRTDFNLIPVFFASGAILYFTAPAEPYLPVLLIVLLIGSWAWIRQKSRGITHVLLGILVFTVCGFTAAKIRTELKAAPVIERQLTAELSGVIVDISRNSRGAPRYAIRPLVIDGLPTQKLPKLIRLSASSKHSAMRVGDTIAGLARMFPFTGPAYPGGYSFYFHGWFRGMGGTGFFMGPPKKMQQLDVLSLTEQITGWINNWRGSVASRLSQAIPGESGDIAIALVTGDRSGLDKQTQESLRRSGLAHILAISGMHMALVTLTVIGVVKSAGAVWPGLVLRYPLHKYAAVMGFIAASIYLLLSGAGTATLRAWIMISTMLLAVLIDRKAVTMRSVAIGAMIILVLAPESILSPGFQMSFAAVAALVATYDAWRTHRAKKREQAHFSPSRTSLAIGSLLGKYIVGILVTSLVAGAATALFSAYHFHRIAPLGLLANLLAMPLVSVAVIPLGLVSMVLMPLGYEKLTLVPFSMAINGVLDISNYVNELGPQGITGVLPSGFLITSSIAMVVLCVMRSRIRLLGIGIFVFASITFSRPPVPDLLIAETGRAIAVKNIKGDLELLYPRKNRFVSEIWLKAWPQRGSGSVESEQLHKLPSLAESCDNQGCSLLLPGGDQLEVVYAPAQIQSACQKADILVAPRLWWVRCKKRIPKLILKRHDFEQYGSHAIYQKSQGPSHENQTEDDPQYAHYRVERALPSTHRKWNRNVSEK